MADMRICMTCKCSLLLALFRSDGRGGKRKSCRFCMSPSGKPNFISQAKSPLWVDGVTHSGNKRRRYIGPCDECGEPPADLEVGFRYLGRLCDVCSCAKRALERRAGGQPRRDLEAAKVRDWSARNKDKVRAIQVRYLSDPLNKLKHKARCAVTAALKAGKLARQPCERCGATDRVHAHHDDYSKALEVQWLCPVHHSERHRELEFDFMLAPLPANAMPLVRLETPCPSPS